MDKNLIIFGKMTEKDSRLQMVAKPLVSVVIPAYNAVEYIGVSIRSIYEQTYDNIEIVVIDDGSTDGTYEVVEQLKSEMSNLFCFRKMNGGISSALNFGIEKCRGEYIARMDADDISFPHRIAEQVRFLELNFDIDIVSSSYIEFDKESGVEKLIDHPSDPNIIRLLLCYCSPVCHPAVIARSAVYKKFRYDSAVAAEDHKLWCEMAACQNISNINQPLLMYRKTASSLSKRKLSIIRLQTIRNGYLFFLKSHNYIKDIKFNEIRRQEKLYRNIRWFPAYFYWMASRIFNVFDFLY
jgi:glycosyltransferase involved in cell wall biosynthesis